MNSVNCLQIFETKKKEARSEIQDLSSKQFKKKNENIGIQYNINF